MHNYANRMGTFAAALLDANPFLQAKQQQITTLI